MEENRENIKTREESIDEFEKNLVADDEIGGGETEGIETEDESNSGSKLIVEKSDPTIASLKDKFNRGFLILQPDYQRKYVMTKPVASRLIESIIIGIPIPAVYFAEEKTGAWNVIDGQQRLTSILSFVQGSLIKGAGITQLTGLNIMNEYKNKEFSQLPVEIQNKILDTPIHSIIIRKESDENVKFEIFERLNTGSTPLNVDEIRNTIYRGNYNRLLTDLSDYETFKKALNKPNFHNRMIDKGMILRFFAFYERSHLNYKPSMKIFCNKHMNQFKDMDSTKAEEYKKVFKDAISSVYTVFGENAFRRLVKDDKNNGSNWVKSRINMALFDVEMYGFTRYKKEAIIRHSDEIRDAMYDLMLEPSFVESIEIDTNSTKSINKRFSTWLTILDNIMQSDNKNPRVFPYSVKEKLYNDDPTCKICGQRIMTIDDAHVDHIKPFANGGETSLENAQITHRYCNQHKSNIEG